MVIAAGPPLSAGCTTRCWVIEVHTEADEQLAKETLQT